MANRKGNPQNDETGVRLKRPSLGIFFMLNLSLRLNTEPFA